MKMKICIIFILLGRKYHTTFSCFVVVLLIRYAKLIYIIQGRETPSPGETPYMCRQRNSLARSTGSIGGTEQQEVNEMERGHLLSLPVSHPTSFHSVQVPHPHVNAPTV